MLPTRSYLIRRVAHFAREKTVVEYLETFASYLFLSSLYPSNDYIWSTTPTHSFTESNGEMRERLMAPFGTLRSISSNLPTPLHLLFCCVNSIGSTKMCIYLHICSGKLQIKRKFEIYLAQTFALLCLSIWIVYLCTRQTLSDKYLREPLFYTM